MPLTAELSFWSNIRCSSYLDIVLPAVGFLEILCSVGQSLRDRAHTWESEAEAGCLLHAQPKALSIPSTPEDHDDSGPPSAISPDSAQLVGKDTLPSTWITRETGRLPAQAV